MPFGRRTKVLRHFQKSDRTTPDMWPRTLACDSSVARDSRLRFECGAVWRRTLVLRDLPWAGAELAFGFVHALHSKEQRFLTHDVVEPARSQLLQKADDFQFAIPAYCFMPDHL